MGRIKTKAVKRITQDLIEGYFEEFSEDYDQNKVIVEKYADVPSKKLRNIITGYVTRQVRSRDSL